MKTIITTQMKKEAIKQIEYVISLAGRFPEHREDVSKAFDALDLLLKTTRVSDNSKEP